MEMEVDSVIENDSEREGLITSCLKFASELKGLEFGELRLKSLRMRQQNKQLEDELGESGVRPERDGQQEMVGISDCWVYVFEVDSGQDVGQRNGGQENQVQDSYFQEDEISLEDAQENEAEDVPKRNGLENQPQDSESLIGDDLEREEEMRRYLQLKSELKKLKNKLFGKSAVKNLKPKQFEDVLEVESESEEQPEVGQQNNGKDNQSQDIDCTINELSLENPQENEPEYELQRTELKNQDSDSLQCQHPGCGRRYKSKKSLYFHRYHHHIHTTKYECQVCQKCFSCVSYLQIHLRKHTGERPFACQFEGCGQRFKHNFTLKNHIQLTHSDDFPFQCPYEGCLKRFKLKTHVKTHFKQIHSDDRPFHCTNESCLESFKTKALSKLHFKEVHSGVYPVIVPPDIVFPVIVPLRCHYEGCQKTFKRKPNLQDHLKTHSDARSFSCQFPGCSKSFKTNANLIAHKNYNGHKYLSFRCHHKDCLKMFETNTHLQKHLQMHSPNRPFKCQFPGCSSAFQHKCALNQHMFVHSDSKPFRCEVANCQKSFKSKGNLFTHQISHL